MQFIIHLQTVFLYFCYEENRFIQLQYTFSSFVGKIGGSLFCGKITCGSPHLWEEKIVGEDKNVGWGIKVWGGR